MNDEPIAEFIQRMKGKDSYPYTLLALASDTWKIIIQTNGGIPADASVDSVPREVVRQCRLLLDEIERPTVGRRETIGVDESDDSAAADSDYAEHLEYDE